ncbi:TlpA family protein disulfide reductase [Desulfovulcanus sp.]
MRKFKIIIVFIAIFLSWADFEVRTSNFELRTLRAGWAGETSSLTSINHQQLISRIAQANGKVVILNFWASWCPPCRMEIPGLMQVRKKYGQEVLILGVSVDEDVNTLRAFLQKNKINYPVFWATPDVNFVFGVRNLPRLVVYNQEGEKILVHEGYMPPEQLERVIDRLLQK